MLHRASSKMLPALTNKLPDEIAAQTDCGIVLPESF
jgi:hypothetical protein